MVNSLTLLRQLFRKTQKEFADFTSIPQSLISQCESGMRTLTMESKIKISHKCGVPITFFDIPCTLSLKENVYCRKLWKTSAKDTDFRLASFHEICRISRILHDENKKSILTLPQVSNKTFFDTSDIEFIADQTRTALNVEPGSPVYSLMRRIEKTGVYIAPLINLESEKLSSGHPAISTNTNNVQVIGYVPCSGDKLRLALAHELGHIILHSHQETVVDEKFNHAMNKIQEKEAMHFAAALLYPKEQAYKDISEPLDLMGYTEIKAKWGVPIQFLIHRAKELHIISNDKYKSLMAQFHARKWQHSEPVEVKPEHPALLKYLLTERFGGNPYFTAAQQFSTSPTFIQTWIPTPPDIANEDSNIIFLKTTPKKVNPQQGKTNI